MLAAWNVLARLVTRPCKLHVSTAEGAAAELEFNVCYRAWAVCDDVAFLKGLFRVLSAGSTVLP